MKKSFKKPRQWRAYVTMVKYFFLAQTRNPATFAFGFIFPVVFISIFGLIGSGSQSFTIGIPDNTNQNNIIVDALKKQPFVKIENGNEGSLKQRLIAGKIGGVIEVQELSQTPPKYKVNMITSSVNIQQAGPIQGLVRGIVDQANLKLAGVNDPAIVTSQEEVAGRTFRYIDFALPGQIGFSLLSTALFGTVFGLIFLKKSLVLKRMFASPTKAMTILLAQGSSRLIVALMQTLLILGIGVFVFKFYLPHGWVTLLDLIILSTIGLVAFLGFGYFFAGIASDENSAGPLVNLASLPQFLLSGTFFSTDSLPSWLQPIANNLPLSYFNIAIRKVTTEGGSLQDTIPYMLGLLLWGAVMYILAARTFRWQ